MINYVTFVLDESGSMESIKDDTIGGFNQFLSELNKVATPETPTRFTLVKFDSNRQEVVHKGVPLEGVPPLTTKSYQPGAQTPLIDACVKAIRATEKAVEGEEARVQVVIQTDGQENASAEFTNQDLALLIKEKTEAGWLFIFLGAGQDAFAQAAKFGIAPGRALNYARQSTRQAFAGASRMSAEYSSTGSSKEFTAEERGAAAGAAAGAAMDPAKVSTVGAAAAAESRRSTVDDMDF